MTSKKSQHRNALFALIKEKGFEAAMYCSYCQENNRRCIMATSTSRCSECVRTSRPKCDGKPEFLDGWEALARQEEQLEQEEEEAMAKILRLRKQKKFLQRRRQDMMARGFRSLAELDAAEEKEKKEKEERERKEERLPQQELGATESLALAGPGQSGLDPSFDPFEVYPPDDPFWQGLDFSGRILPASQSSSRGSVRVPRSPPMVDNSST